MEWLNVYTRFRLARDDLALRHTETNFVFGTRRNFVNLGHIWSRQFYDAQTQAETIHEFAGGIGIGITDRWSVRWNAIYNATNDNFQQHNGALYYEHPCYYLSFGYRRDNAKKADYVGTTTFQFRFGISVDGKHY